MKKYSLSYLDEEMIEDNEEGKFYLVEDADEIIKKLFEEARQLNCDLLASELIVGYRINVDDLEGIEIEHTFKQLYEQALNELNDTTKFRMGFDWDTIIRNKLRGKI